MNRNILLYIQTEQQKKTKENAGYWKSKNYEKFALFF